MRELLELLEQNPSLPVKELAIMLGKPVEEVTTAIKQLEAENIIVKYHTIINWDKAGVDKVTAVIEVKITPQREVGFNAIAESIYHYPEVRSLYLMSGAYDLLAIIEGSTLKEVAHFVATRLATIEGVISTTTHFMLKKFKEEGIILNNPEQDRRLVVSP
ncbi:MAG: Lrp/AsnC family transcriptional regulator [Veillonellales bacterium]